MGTNALTLITPLKDHAAAGSGFQLQYRGDEDEAPRQYRYTRGKAIVFGAGFLHSTEPGRAHGEEPHAFLCLTFGTDQLEWWPSIAEKGLRDQARLLVNTVRTTSFCAILC